MSKKGLIAKLDEVIGFGNLSEKDKNKLIEVKKEIEQISYVSEALKILTSGALRILGNDTDLFQ